MKKIILLMIILVLLSGCNLTKEECKETAFKVAREWQELGYNQGVNDGLDLCIEERDKILEQFNPPKGAIIIVLDEYTMNYMFEDNEYYKKCKGN